MEQKSDKIFENRITLPAPPHLGDLDVLHPGELEEGGGEAEAEVLQEGLAHG